MRQPLVRWLSDEQVERPETASLSGQLAYLRRRGLAIPTGFRIDRQIDQELLLPRGKTNSILSRPASERLLQAYHNLPSHEALILLGDQTVFAAVPIGSAEQFVSAVTQLAETLSRPERKLAHLLALALPKTVAWSGNLQLADESAQIDSYAGYPALLGRPALHQTNSIDLFSLRPSRLAEQTQRYQLAWPGSSAHFQHRPTINQSIPDHLLTQIAIQARQLVGTPIGGWRFRWVSDGDEVYFITVDLGERDQFLPTTQIIVPGFAVGPARQVRSSTDLARIVPGDIVLTDYPRLGLIAHLELMNGLVLSSQPSATHPLVEASRRRGLPVLVAPTTPAVKTGQLVTLDSLSGQLFVGKRGRPSAISSRPLSDLKHQPRLSVSVTDAADVTEIPAQATAGIGSWQAGIEQLWTVVDRLSYLPIRYQLGADQTEEVWRAELDELTDLASHHANMSLLLPNCRSATEAKKRCQKIAQLSGGAHHRLPLWLTIASPGLVTELNQLEHLPLGGLVVDLRQLVGYLFATDQPTVELSVSLATLQTIEQIAESAKRLDLPWAMRTSFDDMSPELAEICLDQEITEFIVPADELSDFADLLHSLHHHRS